MELISLLQSSGISIREHGANTGKEHINICCPFCNEARFHCGIHRTQLWFKCFVCGEGGNWNKIREKLYQKKPEGKWFDLCIEKESFYVDEIKKDFISQKEVYWREFNQSNDTELYSWLIDSPKYEDLFERYRSRSVGLSSALDYGLMTGIKKLEGYAVFKTGENVVARKISSDYVGTKWWKNTVDSTFLFGANWTKKANPVVGVITEGIFDSMRIPVGVGVALLGSAVSDKLILEISKAFEKTETLILALDRDANQKSLDVMQLMLSDLGFSVVRVDWNTVEDRNLKDIDEVFLYEPESLQNLLGLEVLDDTISLL